MTRYPSLFTSDFDKNKQALSQVSVIHARSIRNQLAGAITRIVHERGPSESGEKELTLGEQIIAQVEQETQVPVVQPELPVEKPSSPSESKPQEETPAAQ